MLLRSAIPRRLCGSGNSVVRRHASSHHHDVMPPRSNQRMILSSLSTAIAETVDSSSKIHQREFRTMTLFDDHNKVQCPVKYLNHPYVNSQQQHHHSQGFITIGGGHLQHQLKQQQQVQYSQSRKLSSSSTSNGTDNNNEGEDSTIAGSNNENDDRQADLGIPGAQKGGKKLAIVFTCTVCNTRSAKQFTENSYRHGVVIVQCPGCKSRHLIADNLGFFADDDSSSDDGDGGWNIEKGMAKLGRQDVQVVTNDDVLELSIEDVWGDQLPVSENNNTVGDNKESKK